MYAEPELVLRPAYCLTTLDMRLVNAGRLSWHVLIVTEWWRSETEESLRTAKGLNVVRGKPTSMTARMRW
jgi:hypothetical protein